MDDISLHIMDIVENSIRAEATFVSVKIEASPLENILKIEIRDNGAGMYEEQIKQCEDPFYTTKACGKTGLGLSLLKQSALEANGSFSISSEKGKGSAVTAVFQYDHIDRKPLGDIPKTFYVMIAAFPSVDFFFSYKKNDLSFEIITPEIKKELEDIPITAPDVLKTLRDSIYKGIRSIEKG